MKLYICEETGSVYWLEGESLIFAPQSRNSFVLDTANDGGEVEEGLAEEKLENGRTLGEVWEEARRHLEA
jgi:hypothetical protein